jgi:hypothetical protein
MVTSEQFCTLSPRSFFTATIQIPFLLPVERRLLRELCPGILPGHRPFDRALALPRGEAVADSDKISLPVAPLRSRRTLSFRYPPPGVQPPPKIRRCPSPDTPQPKSPGAPARAPESSTLGRHQADAGYFRRGKKVQLRLNSPLLQLLHDPQKSSRLPAPKETRLVQPQNHLTPIQDENLLTRNH